MAFKTMTTETTADTKARTIAVTVEHDPRQSYRRAVRPAANKACKRWVSENIVFGRVTPDYIDYHDEEQTYNETGRCHTTFHYNY